MTILLMDQSKKERKIIIKLSLMYLNAINNKIVILLKEEKGKKEHMIGA